jgi:hypothetical protein
MSVTPPPDKSTEPTLPVLAMEEERLDLPRLALRGVMAWFSPNSGTLIGWK